MIVNIFLLLLIFILILHTTLLLQPFPARVEPRQPCDRSSHCWPRLKVTTKMKTNHDKKQTSTIMTDLVTRTITGPTTIPPPAVTPTSRVSTDLGKVEATHGETLVADQATLEGAR